MHVIDAKNVNHAYVEAMVAIALWGKKESTRNGEVMAMQMPVATRYRYPQERMLFDAKRDANPFFHVMEAMWMLAGHNDVALVSKFAKNMLNFSDDTKTLNGAYGYRWREHFGIDQLGWVIQHLRKDPHSRRAHIAMWDPQEDPHSIETGTKDVPCNTSIDFRIIGHNLNMTVYCRSNDIVWGCYGANVVHMSFMQEYVARVIGCQVGTYTQVSNNWHIYPLHYPLLEGHVTGKVRDPYLKKLMGHMPIVESAENAQTFLNIVEEFVDDAAGKMTGKLYRDPYIDLVLKPLVMAWDSYKEGDHDKALEHVSHITDDAISLACEEWLARRVK